MERLKDEALQAAAKTYGPHSVERDVFLALMCASELLYDAELFSSWTGTIRSPLTVMKNVDESKISNAVLQKSFDHRWLIVEVDARCGLMDSCAVPPRQVQ